MKKILEAVSALLSLARMVKEKPDDRVKIESMTKATAEKLRGARPRDILHICDEVVMQGFSSSSDTMDPDGKGGIVWAPERSRIYCECFFRLADTMKYTDLVTEKDLFRRILGRGMNISLLISFCNWLRITTPLPNLLSFEGRNETARMLRPKMPELTEYILSLNNQAKELEKQNRHEEAQKSREIAKKLNELYGKMEQRVLPWLERIEKKRPEKADESKLTLGKALGIEGKIFVDILKDVIKETTK